MGRVTGEKTGRAMPLANAGRKKSFLRVAVNDIELFFTGQSIERYAKRKNIQIDRLDVEPARPVNFVGNVRRDFFSRLFGVKHMHLAVLSYQSAGQLMHRDLAAPFKARPGRGKYCEADF